MRSASLRAIDEPATRPNRAPDVLPADRSDIRCDKSARGAYFTKRQTLDPGKFEAVACDIAASLQRIGFRNVQLMPEDMHLGDRLRRDGIHLLGSIPAGVQVTTPLVTPPPLWKCWAFPTWGTTRCRNDPGNKHASSVRRYAPVADSPILDWNRLAGRSGRNSTADSSVPLEITEAHSSSSRFAAVPPSTSTSRRIANSLPTSSILSIERRKTSCSSNNICPVGNSA